MNEVKLVENIRKIPQSFLEMFRAKGSPFFT